MENLLYSPPVAAAVFFAVAWFLYWLGGILQARGEASPGKHLPYTGGELPRSLPGSLGYQAFYRLALLFAILHVGALVISTLPNTVTSHRTAAIYLCGIALSVFVLTGREH
ncbi:MAG: hypothetical protein ACP5HG_13215 [Anaerolineae bacterium]